MLDQEKGDAVTLKRKAELVETLRGVATRLR
jgi:hypothetical protein